jgi:peptidoglycan/LPS O-acetylase OafA/YrhL
VEAHPSEGPEYFPALDGVRALAIAGVLFAHVLGAAGFLLNPGHPADRAVIAAALRGWIGVDLFFVLSGFLITRILLESRASPVYYQRFYARRVLRIFPLYYTALALTLLLLPRLSTLFDADRSSAWVYWLYVSNIPAALWAAWREPFYLAHFWSLAIEEQFYVVWPAVVRRPTVRFLALLCAAVVVVAIGARIAAVFSGVQPYFNYKMLFTRMDALAVGALLACLERMPRVWRRARAHAPAVFVGGGLLILLFGRGLLAHPLTQTAGFTANALASAGLIVMALNPSAASRVRRVLESAPLTYIGRRSYGMYVLHPLVAVGLAGTFSGWAGGLTGFVLFGLLAAAGTVVLAEVSWRLVERPLLGFKRLVPRPAADPAPRAQV